MTRDSEAKLAPDATTVPRLYVDAAQVHIQPYSVHLILAVNDIEGAATPQVHLTMSPHFAIHLKDALVEVLRSYEQPDTGAETDRPGRGDST